jgi:CRP/FNR family transcriptional regulator, cyclic AMP receptor protein
MSRTASDRLRKFDFFAALSDAAFDTLNRQCSRKTFGPREVIIGHQDDTHEVLFILDGRARVNIYSRVGQRVSFREISQGAIFGELSAIDGQPRSTSVESVDTCSTAIMPQRVFMQALEDHQAFRIAVLRHITQLARKLTDRVFEFSTLAVRGRVYAELLRIAEPLQSGDNEALVSPAPTHEEIASRISTHREAVTLELARLEELGLISRTGRTLRIINMAGLRRLSGEQALE